MKRKLKAIFAISAVIGIPALINHYIFKRIEKRNLLKPKEHIYRWKFGNIRYTESGNGKPLLLIHGIGLGCGLHEWNKNIDSLSKNYRVYALDMIGFGYSDKPGISYSPYLYIKLINDFIKEVIGENIYVAANSDAASYVIAAYNFEPHNYNKILLISPTGIGTAKNPPIAYDKWIQRILDLPIIGTSAYNIINSKLCLKFILKEYIYSNSSNVTGDVVNKYYEAAHFGGVNAKYPISTYLSRFLNIDIERLFYNIYTPIHVVWGEKNILNPVSNFDIIKKINAEVKLTIFKNAKVLPHYENPIAFNKVCEDFFD